MSTVVHRDSHRLGEGRGNLGSSELSEGESSSELNLARVFPGLSEDDGPELADGSGELGSSLGSSDLSPDLLVSRLVEEASDSSLPVLPHVRAGDHVVVFYHVANK